MKRVFFNADDFGMTDGVCGGVLAAMEHGVVRGTTAMVCAPGAQARLAAFAPGSRTLAGRLGLHFQLTSGAPCLPPQEVPSLVGPDGLFPKKRKGLGALDPNDVGREWRAQLARLRDLGVAPSHLDSHHHVHRLPAVFPIFCELARETGLPARAVDPAMAAALADQGVPRPDRLITDWFGEDLSLEKLLSLLDETFAALGGAGTVEVMTHPGEPDADLAAVSSYVGPRGRELEMLLAPALFEALRERGVRLVGPGEV